MTHSGESWRLGHRPALDGLRGIAIGLVLLGHGNVPGAPFAGRVGVTLFFVLSGFLITALLLEEHARAGRVSLRRFYARRVRRLGPAFALMFIIACVLGAAAGEVTGLMSVRDAVLSVSYVGNWYPALMAVPKPAPLGVLSGTWSLAVEEQFYLVWPLVLIVAVRRGPRRVLAVAAVGAAASLALRFVLLATSATGFRIYYGTDTNALALLAGAVIAAMLVQDRGTVVARWVPVVAVAGLFVVGARQDLAWAWIMVPAVILSAVAVGALGADRSAAPWLTATWLRWLGRRSYAVYLWNTMIATAVFYLPLSWPVRLAVTAGLALLLAELSWRCVERPFLRSGRGGVGGHAGAGEGRVVERDLVDEGAGDGVGAT